MYNSLWHVWIQNHEDTIEGLILTWCRWKSKWIGSFTLEWGMRKVEQNCHGGGNNNNGKPRAGMQCEETRLSVSQMNKTHEEQQSQNSQQWSSFLCYLSKDIYHGRYKATKPLRALPQEDAHPRTTGVGVSCASSDILPFQFSLTAVALGAQQSSTHKAQSWGSALITTWFGAPPWNKKNTSYCSKKEWLTSWRQLNLLGKNYTTSSRAEDTHILRSSQNYFHNREHLTHIHKQLEKRQTHP